MLRLVTTGIFLSICAATARQPTWDHDHEALLQTQVESKLSEHVKLSTDSVASVPDSGFVDHMTKLQHGACITPYPFGDAHALGVARVMGYVPPLSGCLRDNVTMFPQLKADLKIAPVLPGQEDNRQASKSYTPRILLLVYLLIVSVSVFLILHSIVKTPTNTKCPTGQYPERDAWNSGVIHWLWMGWATPWICLWGNAEDSGVTKIDSNEIPMTDPDDECQKQYEIFKEVWDVECARNGLENISLIPFFTRFITQKKVAIIALWNAFYEGMMFLGPPLAIEWVTKYISKLYVQREQNIVVPESELVLPSLGVIALFTGLPAVMAISNSVSSLLDSRISIRIGGALSCAVFAKAQRLPFSMRSGDDDDQSAFTKAETEEEKAKKEKEEEEKALKAKNLTEEEELEELLKKEEGGKKPGDPEDEDFEWLPVPKRFNVCQLIANDISVNIMAVPLALARMVVMIPVLCITLGLLLTKIGSAFLFSMGVFLVNIVLMVSIGLMMRKSLMTFMNTSGLRLQFFQQVMFGIRFIKGFGGEQVVFERFERSRAKELESLDQYYTFMNLMFAMNLCFPKLYLLVGLGGAALLKGEGMDPADIIAIIPILFSVQASVAVVFSLVPILIMAIPSCKRLETFLKQPEAPRLLPPEKRAQRAPGWIKLWPDEPDENTMLRVQGNFSWEDGGVTVLRDLDLEVPHGQLIGIVGQVGCGKTTMLHAILGELFNRGDARIEAPERIAYSAQVAHLFEGTLKENVLQGELLDETRYHEALRSASLLADLQVLPGHDEVPVGSRGITLSGGQKARLSMARAAYNKAPVVLIDDPFGSVDACTAEHLLQHLLLGNLLKNRTRIITCQPDADRLQKFDWVVCMKKGRIAQQGTPADIMNTPVYRSLLSKRQLAAQENGVSIEDALRSETTTKKAPVVDMVATASCQDGFKLREEEFEGRASWETIAYFGRNGGWFSIFICIAFYLLKNIFDVIAQASLAAWMNHGVEFQANLVATSANPILYLLSFVFWMIISTIAWFISFAGGKQWTLSISKVCHTAMMKSLLRAPIDRFYDKTPVGRIMNRMANDMMNVDTNVFLGVCSTIGMIWSLLSPLLYVHYVTPAWFFIACMPFYYLVLSLLRLYWKTMVPLRYLMQVSKSAVNDEVAEVESSNSSVRAYGKSDYRLEVFQKALRAQIASDFVGKTLLMRWLCNRLFVLGGFFVTCLALLVVWVPGALDTGSSSLCMLIMFQIIVMVESNITIGASAQYQIIAMNRVYEYTKLPMEAEEEFATDKAFKNLTIRIARSALAGLEYQGGADGVQVHHRGRPGDVVLEQVPYKAAFLPARGKSLADLAPSCKALRSTDTWHRIVGVNSSHGMASEMAKELCQGTQTEVTLHVQSGWLADGVKVEIKNLRAGYADIPRDVLQGINLSIPRRCKAGIAGTTGCGKSTLLLSLLRILEPRNGKIYLEGVDTQNIGLKTLRMAIGLVPQDPVLLQGPLRLNVDPFEQYDDERIWEALRFVSLEDHIREQEGGLDFQVSADGSNLSHGQRQLMSLARNILRQPMLLLLDEATSAIDPHTQGMVQNTIKRSFPDSTMIVIAHRLETIIDFDLIAILDSGRVVEKGPPGELAEMQDGYFAKLLRAHRRSGEK